MMNHWRPEQMLGLRLWRDCKHPEGGGCVDFYPVASDPRLVLVTDGLISLLSLKALFWWLCEIQSIAFAVFCLSSFQQCGGCFRCWCTNAAHLVENQAGIEGCVTSCIRWSMLSLRALGLLLTLRSLRPLTCTLTPALSTDHLISLFFKIVQIFLTPASPTSSLVYFFSFLLSLLCQRKERLLFKVVPTTIHSCWFVPETLFHYLFHLSYFFRLFCEMTKLKQFNNKSAVPLQGKILHGVWSPRPPKQCCTLPEGFGEQRVFG